MIAALIGNPNCGKSTCFNQLTGMNQHVGNFPGITVEIKEGKCLMDPTITLIDLPGTYSLIPFTPEEKVAVDFLTKQPIDCIINIIDAGCLQRSLYLTCQLKDLNIPVIALFNMMDEVENNGGKIDFAFFKERLKMPVLPICAMTKTGLDQIVAAIKNCKTESRIDYSDHPFSTLQNNLADKLAPLCAHPYHEAALMIQGCIPELKAAKSIQAEAEALIHEYKAETDGDLECGMITFRHRWIEAQCELGTANLKLSKETERSIAIDRVLTHPVFSIFLFLFFLIAIYGITFGPFGSFLSSLCALLLDRLRLLIAELLRLLAVSAPLTSLVLDGIFSGVGSILSFLPPIMLLFLLLSFLEDAGYMSRVAFILDAPMQKIGLCGKSVVCLLMGMGCSVPAILSTRTLGEKKERYITMLLVPFISCSAKLPVYTLILMTFFHSYRSLMLLSVYALNLALACLFSLFLNRFVFFNSPSSTILELPNYRFPNFQTVFETVRQKAVDFIARACTVILLASIIIWFLESFTFDLRYTEQIDASIIAHTAKSIAFFFKPLGLQDWRVVTSLLAGFSAKEAVLSSLAVLLHTPISALSSSIPLLMSFPASVSLLVFVSLYTPCLASIAVIKKEFNSSLIALEVALFQTALAWIVAFLVYRFILCF